MGTGSYVRRRESIQTKIKEDVDLICEQMIKRLVDGVAERKSEVPGQLREAAAEGPRNIEQQLLFLVNNLIESFSADPKMNAKKNKLQNDVRAHIEAWEVAWAEKGNYKQHILDLNVDIPEDIPEPVFKDTLDSGDEDANDSSDNNDDED